jgi:dolichyl-phosphate beta-glucosyltransferase
MAKSIFLSVIVPVYNEEQRLANLSKVAAFLKKMSSKTELVVVNDGSTDTTLEMIKKLQKQYRFRIISYSPNRGKGYALRRGMLAAEGEYRLFMDVDLSVPLKTISLFVENLGQEDIIIGTRRLKESQVLTHQPKLRERFGQIFTKLSQWWLDLEHSDFTCGFKCFTAEATERIFSQLHIERWGYDTELLFVAKQAGFTVKEIPVSWKNDERTKVKFPQDIIRSFLDLLEVRYHFRRGRYH